MQSRTGLTSSEVSSSSAAHSSREIVNPATGELIASLVDASPDEVNSTIGSARRAQSSWGSRNPQERGELLGRWADLITERAEEIANLDTANIGKPIRHTSRDVPASAQMARYWGGVARYQAGATVPLGEGHLHMTRRRPLGVVGLILPWNAPANAFIAHVSAIVALGNSVVVKPSERSPLSAIRLAALAAEAGLPEGVVNVVLGGSDVGQYLVSHSGVDGISFTGSEGVGRQIASECGRQLKPCVAELGGKSPVLVFSDADLNDAALGIVSGGLLNAGQLCTAGTRVLIEREVFDTTLELVDVLLRRLKVGDPVDPSTHIGPLAFPEHLDRVVSTIDRSLEQGARVRLGNWPQQGIESGYVEPLVLSGPSPEAAVATEEIFGPVLWVHPFDSEEEAVHLANATPYGLSASIWTQDANRLLALANKIDAGVIWGNTTQLNNPALPFGGIKGSGLGNALADGAVEAYTRWSRVSIRYDSSKALPPGWEDIENGQ